MREESNSRNPSLNRVRERKLRGESLDVGCGVGSFGIEKSKLSAVRGNEFGGGMWRSVHILESFRCRDLCVSAGLDVKDCRLAFIGWIT